MGELKQSLTRVQSAVRCGISGKLCNARKGLFWTTEGRLFSAVEHRCRRIVAGQVFKDWRRCPAKKFASAESFTSMTPETSHLELPFVILIFISGWREIVMVVARGRVADAVVLSDEERRILEGQVRRHKLPRSPSDRCRTILLCAGGLTSKEVACRLGRHEYTFDKWQR